MCSHVCLLLCLDLGQEEKALRREFADSTDDFPLGMCPYIKGCVKRRIR